MQVIAGTFDAYAGPYRNTGPFEYGVSTNPEANIYAGTNYAIHRYGNPGFLSVLGHGHGYAGGGLAGMLPGFAAGGDVPGWTNLNNAVRAEMTAFWKLMGDKIPVSSSQVTSAQNAYNAAVKKYGKNSKQAKGALNTLSADKKGPVITDAQAKAWKAWDTALSNQQLKTVGLGRQPPGAYDTLSSAMSPYPGDVPPKDWLAFQNELSNLIHYQGGIGVPGGVNPPGTPPDSGWAPWKYAHGDWQSLRNWLLKVQSTETAAYAGWQPTTHTYGGDVGDVTGRTLALANTSLGAATGGYLSTNAFRPVKVGSFDSGGYLTPGWNMAWNGTGTPEPVGAASGGEVHVHIHNEGVIGSQAELDRWLTTSLRRVAKTAGGGSVQRAFGGH
jgi:hypothetical protein